VPPLQHRPRIRCPPSGIKSAKYFRNAAAHARRRPAAHLRGLVRRSGAKWCSISRRHGAGNGHSGRSAFRASRTLQGHARGRHPVFYELRKQKRARARAKPPRRSRVSLARARSASADGGHSGAHLAGRVGSRPIASRLELENALRELEQRSTGAAIACPEGWGGYRLLADEIEFWINREGRLHDRMRYRDGEAGWQFALLAP
jgi:hypothetical protein